jgi:hypothetical protein
MKMETTPRSAKESLLGEKINRPVIQSLSELHLAFRGGRAYVDGGSKTEKGNVAMP